MMNVTRFLITILLCIVISACSKDYGEYQMENKDFVAPVYYEQLYQQALNKTLSTLPGNQAINDFALKRLLIIEKYLTELIARTKTEDWPAQRTLPDDKLQKLAELNIIPVAQNKSKLTALLQLSDQDMIGFHVKASGSIGLKDKVLRDWTNDKLKLLLQNLQEIQNINP